MSNEANKKEVEGLLTPQKKQVWYFKTSALVIAFLVVGPLALPLLWWNPRFKVIPKIFITLVLLVLTWYLTIATVDSLRTIKEYYDIIVAG